MPEIATYLQGLDSPAPSFDEGLSCSSFFSDISRRGVSVILADGGAGKSFSTLRRIAELARQGYHDLKDHRTNVEDDWDLPIWIRASSVLRILTEAERVDLSPLETFLANPIQDIVAPPQARKEDRSVLDRLIETKLRAGQVVAVIDGLNELPRDQVRQVNRFQAVLRALAGESNSGSRKGRVILTCRSAAWEEQLRWIPPTLFDSADSYELKKLSDTQIDEYIRNNSSPAETADWTQFFDEWPHVKQACSQPLILALAMSSTFHAGQDKLRLRDAPIPVALVFDGAVDGFLRGRWKDPVDFLNDSSLLEDKFFGIDSLAESSERLLARELISLIAWHLYKSLNGNPAFAETDWAAAFTQSLEVCDQSEMKVCSGLKVLAADLRSNNEKTLRMAARWRKVFLQLGLLIQEGLSYRFLHEALYQFVAASGLSLLVPASRWRQDPWKTAFLKHGIRMDWIQSAFTELFCLLPSAHITWMDRAKQQKAEDIRAFSHRLTRLCKCVRRATQLDFSGQGILVRLALSASCNEIALPEKRSTVKEAIALFRFDHIAQQPSHPELAELGDEYLTSIERKIRPWIRALASDAYLRKFIIRCLYRRLYFRRYLLFRLDLTAGNIVGVCGWLRAVEADERAMASVRERIDRALPRMSIPERAELLKSVNRVTLPPNSEPLPGTFSSKYATDLAKRVWDNTARIVCLPHGQAALDLWPTELRCIAALARPNHVFSPARTEIWDDIQLRQVWDEALKSALPYTNRLQPTSGYTRQFAALLTSAATRTNRFFLWFWVGYFFSAPNRNDQIRVRRTGRFLLRNHGSPYAFHIMAFCATFLRATRGNGLVNTHLTALEADFATLRPSPNWDLTPKLLRVILRSFKILAIVLNVLPWVTVPFLLWLVMTKPHLFK